MLAALKGASASNGSPTPVSNATGIVQSNPPQVNADPISNPQAWDVVVIAGVKSPGLAQVGAFDRQHDFDVKKGKGTIGATLTFTGKPPAKGSIKFLLWTQAHFSAWVNFRTLFKYDPTKQSVQPVDIYHPSLSDVDITSVVCEKLGNAVHDGNGLYSISVELIEYTAPPQTSAVSTAKGSKSTPKTYEQTPGDPPDSASDTKQKELAQLLKKVP